MIIMTVEGKSVLKIIDETLHNISEKARENYDLAEGRGDSVSENYFEGVLGGILQTRHIVTTLLLIEATRKGGE